MDYQNSYNTAPAANYGTGAPAGYNTAPASNDGCLDWDGEIQQESSWELLPEGDYAFIVEKVERGRFSPKPNSKIPACNQATVTFIVGGQTLTDNFPLHTKMEWKISALYAAVGMKQQGEKVRMNWPGIVGRTGYVHVGVREWKKDDGTTGQSNDMRKFYVPWDKDYQDVVQAVEQQVSAAPMQQYQQPAPQYTQSQQYAPQQQAAPQNNQNPQYVQQVMDNMPPTQSSNHWTPGRF